MSDECTRRLITKRGKKNMKMAHADWSAFLDWVEELYLAAQADPAARGAGNGNGCCDTGACEGHGGPRYGGESFCVCRDDDVEVCEPGA